MFKCIDRIALPIHLSFFNTLTVNINSNLEIQTEEEYKQCKQWGFSGDNSFRYDEYNELFETILNIRYFINSKCSENEWIFFHFDSFNDKKIVFLLQ